METVLNDLYDYEKIKIYQFKNGFKFSLDSILLAEYVNIKSKKQIIVDFCTGNAVIPLILSTKCENKIYGIELQPEIYMIAKQSVNINNLDYQISIINDNVQNIDKYLKSESVDIITCNPPYFKVKEDSILNENNLKAIARHELKINLEQIIKNAAFLLKNNCYFYMIHRSERLEEIIEKLNKYNFSIKEIQFIYTKEHTNSDLCLIKALKNGKIGLKIKNPLYTNNLKSFKNIFNGGNK